MPRTLLVTNDFPPTVGGIQSYLRDFLSCLDPTEVVVFASTQNAVAAREYDAKQPFPVIRWSRRMMLPTFPVQREMCRIIHEQNIQTVWFGAAAPLALLAGAARKAGASTLVASTHGHEVGWSMLPVARQCLRIIGNSCDVITYISDYTLGRFRSSFGTHPSFVPLPSGVDITRFQSPTLAEKQALQNKWGMPVGKSIVCISRLVTRKGQDSLIAALPAVLAEHPDAQLILVGDGSYATTLRRQAQPLGDAVRFLGRLNEEDMGEVLRAADVFAMPARTRGGGLDVEGLGIVYLEAQACGVPVIAGTSGGAPETVTPETGFVVDGRDTAALVESLDRLLSDAALAHRMGAAGREHVKQNWTWEIMGARLSGVLGQV